MMALHSVVMKGRNEVEQAGECRKSFSRRYDQPEGPWEEAEGEARMALDTSSWVRVMGEGGGVGGEEGGGMGTGRGEAGWSARRMAMVSSVGGASPLESRILAALEADPILRARSAASLLDWAEAAGGGRGGLGGEFWDSVRAMVER